MPTWEVEPMRPARPCGWDSWIRSVHSAPASTLAVLATGSTLTPLMLEVLIRTPPSQGAPTPCPVPRRPARKVCSVEPWITVSIFVSLAFRGSEPAGHFPRPVRTTGCSLTFNDRGHIPQMGYLCEPRATRLWTVREPPLQFNACLVFLQPTAMFEDQVERKGDACHEDQREGVAQEPVQLGHVSEVHPVDSPHQLGPLVGLRGVLDRQSVQVELVCGGRELLFRRFVEADPGHTMPLPDGLIGLLQGARLGGAVAVNVDGAVHDHSSIIRLCGLLSVGPRAVAL